MGEEMIMKLSLNSETDRGKFYEGHTVTETNQPAPEVIAALCQAYALLPGFLGEKFASLVEVVKISFHQEQTEHCVGEYMTAILASKNVHGDLPDGWKLRVEFSPGGLAPYYRGEESTPEKPLPQMGEADRLNGRVYPPELVAERFAREITSEVKKSVDEISAALLELTQPSEEAASK